MLYEVAVRAMQQKARKMKGGTSAQMQGVLRAA